MKVTIASHRTPRAAGVTAAASAIATPAITSAGPTKIAPRPVTVATPTGIAAPTTASGTFARGQRGPGAERAIGPIRPRGGQIRPEVAAHEVPMAASEPEPSAKLISASRRGDVPRYYAQWFAERRRDGFAEYRTAFGVPGRVSLRSSDVLAYLFWTRDARPFMPELRALLTEGAVCALQFTINGYGRELEPHRPSLRGAIESFRAVASLLPGPESIQWRYDPIILSERYPPSYHVARFRSLADQLEGYTKVVNVSVVEPYIKAVRRMADDRVRYRAVDPRRHRSVAKRYPDLPVAADAAALLRTLATVADEHGAELRICCNPEYAEQAAAPASQCIGAELFAPYGAQVSSRVAALPDAPSRSACRCLRSVDIGMDNTCLAGCKYCYVTTSLEAAIKNYRAHDPRSPFLRR